MLATQDNEKSKTPAQEFKPINAPAGEKDALPRNSVWQSLALRPVVVQPKLTISQPGDPYEREADQMADRVMRLDASHSTSTNASVSSNDSLTAQRNCGQCAEEEGENLRRKEQAANPDSVAVAPAVVHQTLDSPGQPLDSNTRSLMEPRIGYDVGDVRLHTDGEAASAARAVHARAFTLGSDIVFGAGEYAPATIAGQRLIAHELAHVAQQRAGHSSVVQRTGWSDAAPGSPNVGKTTVGKMLRIPLSGLKEGNQAMASHAETKEMAADPTVASASDPRGRAIVIVPQSMTSPPEKVEVLLHLHGHNVGYRARKTQGSESGMDKGAMAPGTVRDETVDKIESQIEASGRQMIGVLPQGTAGSEFGAGGLDSTAFIKEALAKVAVELKWAKTPAVGNVALSAHSGGGGRVAEMLPVTGTATKGSLPAGMKELILLDAINGPNELARVKAWTLNQLDLDLGNLSGKSEPDQLTYLKTSMRLRARYTPKYSVPYDETTHAGKPFVEEGGKKWLADASGKKLIKGYGVEYEQLAAAISNWFKTKATGLTPTVVTALRDNYEVKPAGHGFHDAIVGRNDALLTAIKDLP